MSGRRRLLYLDTSAFVKLVNPEPETPALRRHLRQRSAELVSAVLLRTEALRTAQRQSAARVGSMRIALRQVNHLERDAAALRRGFDRARIRRSAAEAQQGKALAELVEQRIAVAASLIVSGAAITADQNERDDEEDD